MRHPFPLWLIVTPLGANVLLLAVCMHLLVRAAFRLPCP
jgi:hypothetical protein